MSRYRITIRGGLDEAAREAFGDFEIGPDGADTVLIGELHRPGVPKLDERGQEHGLQIVDLGDDRRPTDPSFRQFSPVILHRNTRATMPRAMFLQTPVSPTGSMSRLPGS